MGTSAADGAAGTCTVALVITNYNYSGYVAEAIDSALVQSPPYDQIIVVDDGSTDDSRQVLEAYRNRVELLFQANTGPLGAALAGLSLVRCTYVHFLDSDDILEPYARWLIGESVAGTPAKLQFRMRCVSAGRSLQSVIPAYPGGYDNAAMLRDSQLLGFPICPPTSGNVFRVDVLKRLPLERLPLQDAIDGTPNLAMPFCGEVRSVDRVLVSYRIHDNNISQQTTPTPQKLRKEGERLRRRWRELKTIMPDVEVPEPGSTLFELETLHMAAVLEGSGELGTTAKYVARLFQSATPSRKKVLLGMWSLAVAVVPNALARRLVLARRSAVNRGPLTRLVVSTWLGNRKAAAVPARADESIETSRAPGSQAAALH